MRCIVHNENDKSFTLKATNLDELLEALTQLRTEGEKAILDHDEVRISFVRTGHIDVIRDGSK